MTSFYTLILMITGILLFIFIIILKNILTSKVSEKRGDYTPKSLGFGEVNPLRHLDFLGLLLFITSGIGWEKRVELNRTQLKKRGWDLIMIFVIRQLYHILMILVAFVILEVMSISPINQLHSSVIYMFIFQTLAGFIATNGILLLFSFVPFAPFDMFYLVRDLIPSKIAFWLDSMEQYTPWIIALVLSPYSPVFTVIGA